MTRFIAIKTFHGLIFTEDAASCMNTIAAEYINIHVIVHFGLH